MTASFFMYMYSMYFTSTLINELTKHKDSMRYVPYELCLDLMQVCSPARYRLRRGLHHRTPLSR